MKARAAIVIPAYNAAAFLDATLESLLGQTEPRWTAIVVDDGSRDGTADAAQRFAERDPRIRVLREPNGGVAAARNRGWRACDPDVPALMFLDHDDALLPHALADLLAALESDPEAAAAHGLARKADADGHAPDESPSGIQNYNRYRFADGVVSEVPRTAPTTLATVVYDNVIPTPGAAVIRRSALEAIAAADGPFDPAAVPLDDWDLWLRLAGQGHIAFLDRAVILWRRHAGAGTNDSARMRRAEMRLRAEMLQTFAGDPEILAIARNRYDRLLTTSLRRDARERWREATSGFRAGRPGAGLKALRLSLSAYGGYLLRKSIPNRKKRR